VTRRRVGRESENVLAWVHARVERSIEKDSGREKKIAEGQDVCEAGGVDPFLQGPMSDPGFSDD
jgi:hypothetical protein